MAVRNLLGSSGKNLGFDLGDEKKLKFNRLVYCIFFIFSMIISSISFAAPITSDFGWRIHPVTGEWKFHSGIDIGYDEGEPIVAMRSGKVVFSSVYGGYGNCVIVEHDDGDHTLYAHCSSLVARYGDYVNMGEIIAYVGSTGISTGPHLHLEWWHNGSYTNPLGLWNY